MSMVAFARGTTEPSACLSVTFPVTCATCALVTAAEAASRSADASARAKDLKRMFVVSYGRMIAGDPWGLEAALKMRAPPSRLSVSGAFYQQSVRVCELSGVRYRVFQPRLAEGAEPERAGVAAPARALLLPVARPS